MATFYTGRDTSCIEKEVLVNVKMIIAKDKIHVNAVWSLQRLYLPFAQLFDRIPKPNQNTTFDFFLLTFVAASAHSALWSNLSWT